MSNEEQHQCIAGSNSEQRRWAHGWAKDCLADGFNPQLPPHQLKCIAAVLLSQKSELAEARELLETWMSIAVNGKAYIETRQFLGGHDIAMDRLNKNEQIVSKMDELATRSMPPHVFEHWEQCRDYLSLHLNGCMPAAKERT